MGTEALRSVEQEPNLIDFGKIERYARSGRFFVTFHDGRRENITSVAKLLRFSDINSKQYSYWKRGLNAPNFGSIRRIARTLGVDFKDLLLEGNQTELW